MLYPQSNLYRQSIDLSGIWDFSFDPDKCGASSGWTNQLTDVRPIAVPASWNDQFEDGRDYFGDAWYQTRFDLPLGFDSARQQIRLRFGSVNYIAEAWLNGVRLGSHEGGHLPFEFDVTAQIEREDNVLVVRVNGELAFDRVPPGNIAPELTIAKEEKFPAAAYDFFPFCGIHRSVLLYAIPHDALDDVTVTTNIADTRGIVRVGVARPSINNVVRATLTGHGANISVQTAGDEIELNVPNAALWSCESPNLYDLTIELVRDGAVFDRYTLAVGIRTIQVTSDALLLNGKPVYLKGFGRHEDFAINGRGQNSAVDVKDFALMQWMNANSFRTSHYPYSEQQMDLADRLGILVIDETPAVGLFFAEEGLVRRLELCRQMTRDLIARDKNHPCVIAWSLANEPNSVHPNAKPFFQNLYDWAKSFDATRPVTLVSNQGVKEESFDFMDLICLNRYYGWYTNIGQIEVGAENLSRELDAMYHKWHKPIALTEFGADAVPGHHAQPSEMFSEEYQVEMLTRDIEILRSKPFVVGEHVWNMCDFKTAQGIRRVNAMNYKGVFTRDRRPKMAAHRLRELWAEDKRGNK
jgi:beta-glucuronidase